MRPRRVRERDRERDAMTSLPRISGVSLALLLAAALWLPNLHRLYPVWDRVRAPTAEASR